MCAERKIVLLPIFAESKTAVSSGRMAAGCDMREYYATDGGPALDRSALTRRTGAPGRAGRRRPLGGGLAAAAAAAPVDQESLALRRDGLRAAALRPGSTHAGGARLRDLLRGLVVGLRAERSARRRARPAPPGEAAPARRLGRHPTPGCGRALAAAGGWGARPRLLARHVLRAVDADLPGAERAVLHGGQERGRPGRAADRL